MRCPRRGGSVSDLGSWAWRGIKQSRFFVQDPEQLWAMVEAADATAASDLGDLLTQAAKTINQIGNDLWKHSLSVEWKGEGGEAFRTWIYQASQATLSLGDYSENAGKWLGHAADTLHEVKPQLEILRKQSATARSVLDAHVAKSTDVGSHDGGPSDAAVKKAKTSYANDSAEAGGLMMKLAQSYTASTEQINALEAPKFPELPEQFVPQRIHGGAYISVPSSRGGVGGPEPEPVQSPEHKAILGARPSEANSLPSNSRQHVSNEPVLPHATHQRLADPTNTTIDSVDIRPPAPNAPPTPAVSPPGNSAPDVRTPPPTGSLPPAFGGRTTLPQGPRGLGGSSPYGGRNSVPTPSEPITSGTPRASIPGRGRLPGAGPLGPGSQPAPGRGTPSAAPGGRVSNGITGGRPTSPTTGQPAAAIPRGNVIGGTPSQPQTPTGRRSITRSTSPGAAHARGGGRMTEPEGGAQRAGLSARADGIAGGQPKPSQGRGRTPRTPGSAQGVRGGNAGGSQPRRDAGGRDASAPSRKRRTEDSSSNRGERTAHDKRSESRPDQWTETEEEYSRPSPPRLRSGPDGQARQEG
ncbi:hypothetical protein Scel_36070 [Streptomyces cellostaticus]|nr:hypothetical protein Scel_36070 [Streptomyces cellostaticus]